MRESEQLILNQARGCVNSTATPRLLVVTRLRNLVGPSQFIVAGSAVDTSPGASASSYPLQRT